MSTLHCSSVDPVSFLKPFPDLFLPDYTVHVWKFPLSKIKESLLSEKDIALAARFRQEADKLRFTTGRQMLRMLSSQYLSVAPEEIVIFSERHQKPVISSPPNRAFHFNISHSGEWVLIAFADSELGVDIEETKTSFSFQTIIQDQFSNAEQDFVLNASVPVVAFYTLWTRKEALLKGLGSGLQQDLRLIPCLDGIHMLTNENTSWRSDSFRIEDHYQAAVVYSNHITIAKFFDGSGLAG